MKSVPEWLTGWLVELLWVAENWSSKCNITIGIQKIYIIAYSKNDEKNQRGKKICTEKIVNEQTLAVHIIGMTHELNMYTIYHFHPFYPSIFPLLEIFSVYVTRRTLLSSPFHIRMNLNWKSTEIFIWMNGICSLACNIICIQHSKWNHSNIRCLTMPSTVQWRRLFRFLNWMIRLVHQYRQTAKPVHLSNQKGFRNDDYMTKCACNGILSNGMKWMNEEEQAKQFTSELCESKNLLNNEERNSFEWQQKRDGRISEGKIEEKEKLNERNYLRTWHHGKNEIALQQNCMSLDRTGCLFRATG